MKKEQVSFIGNYIYRNLIYAFIYLIAIAFITTSAASGVYAQTTTVSKSESNFDTGDNALAPTPNSSVSRYYDPQQGVSSNDLIRLALANNPDIAAVRLDIDRARARLTQAGLKPNPVLSFEQMNEQLTGSGTDRETGVALYLPLELGGKRQRRKELVQTEILAIEAEVANRERRLVGDVRIAYLEALAALRELQVIENLKNISLKMGNVVEIRVKEGDAAAIELNILNVELNRLQIRSVLIESRLQAALARLKGLTGMPVTESLRLREVITAPMLPSPPSTLQEAIEIAMRTRPDLKLARQNEEVAQANLRLAHAQAIPDITPFAKYSFNRTITDLPTPLVPVPNRSRFLTFGFSIGLPIFNKNQGTQLEASISISQAQRRREYVEATVRIEVTSAYQRYQAVQSALQVFEEGVITRSNKNLESMQAAYKIGAFSVTELLIEQRRLLDAQREFIEALTERYRAIVDLNSAIGTPIDPQ